MFRRLAAVLAATGLMLMVVAPALANDLHQDTPIAWDAAAYQGTEEECATADLDPGEVLWHFVHTDTGSSDLASTLNASFATAGAKVANGYVNGSSIVMYDIVTGEDTLNSASDSIVNGGLLNLSHICAGGPPPEIPEAPMSILLVLAAGTVAFGFIFWRRRSEAVA